MTGDHRALIEEAKEKDLERRFGSWQDYSPGEEDEPIENIVTDAFSLIARLAAALEQEAARAKRWHDEYRSLLRLRNAAAVMLSARAERQAKAVRHHIARSDGLARELGAARAVVEAAIRWRNRLGYYPCDEACSHALCGLVRTLGVEPMGIPEHLQAPGEPTKLSAVAVLAAIAAEGETA